MTKKDEKIKQEKQIKEKGKDGNKVLAKIKEVLINIKTIFPMLIGKVFSKVTLSSIKVGAMHIKLAKDGRGTILVMFAIFVISFVFLGIGAITMLTLFLLLITLYFFRDPDRVLPEKKNIVISPCDGKILKIETTSLPEELGGKDTREYNKISVFMNINDVHVQRMPVDCVVKQIEYIQGAFINADLDKASKDNERNIVLVERENGDNICIVQIAGFIARRIVCHVEKDEHCKIGEKYGMIKFGSRIELYVPKNYKIEVLAGQRVVCGETVVASFEK